MKQSVFIAMVLGGVVVSIFLYSPAANYQGRMIVHRLIDEADFFHRDDEEKKLYDMVLKKPSSDIYGNRDIYKQLVQLNPYSELYRQKLEYYQGLIDTFEKDKNSRPINRNRDLIDSLISQGAISIDKQLFKIYVDTAFWNGMDYPEKNNFCMAVNNIYTGYFMVDKYSGKTLANSNRLGEVTITH